jgi:hypothetical protein
MGKARKLRFAAIHHSSKEGFGAFPDDKILGNLHHRRRGRSIMKYLVLASICFYSIVLQGCAYGGGTMGTGFGAYGGGTVGTGLQYGGMENSGLPDSASYFGISGRLSDQAGKRLEDVDVEVRTSELSETAETRADGTFELQGIANAGSSLQIKVNVDGQVAACRIPSIPANVTSATMELRFRAPDKLSCEGVRFIQER